MTADDHQHTADHGHDGDHGHGGVGKYFLVFIFLCVLTSASFFTYSPLWPWKETPSVGWAFMMAVSCTKALLVMLFFMHLLWEANWKYVLTFPAALMCVFLVLMLVPDVGQRTRYYSEQRWLEAAEPVTHERGDHEDGHHEDGHQTDAHVDDAHHDDDADHDDAHHPDGTS